MEILCYIYFFLFHPTISQLDWQNYMFTSFLIGLGIILVANLLFYLLPYKRSREQLKMWLLIAAAWISTFIAIMVIAYQVPEDMLQTGYRFRFISNYLISTAILDLLLFYVLTYLVPSPKKYFPRVIGVFKGLK